VNWRWPQPLVRAALAAVVIPPLTLLPHVGSSTDMARLRNAMVFEVATREAFEWTPALAPPDFLRDVVRPSAPFTARAQVLHLDSLADDWGRAAAISQHLLTGAPRLSGGPIQAPLDETYQRIVGRGEGYCADFVRVFQALAVAVGLPTRAWAFSFDGYGGHGHIVIEIWNRQSQRWQMLDLFNNVYYTDAKGQPLAALAVRDGFVREPAAMTSVPLVPNARPGYRIEDKLREYYARGLPEWYLWWGTNPYTVDSVLTQAPLNLMPRAAGLLGTIALGVHPKAVALVQEGNAAQRSAMRRLQVHVFVAIALSVVGLVALAGWGVRRWARRHSAPGRFA
jgi:hypothetical protein